MTETATTSRGAYGTCSGCGYLMYPVLPLCPGGDDGEIVSAPLEETGTIYSWTHSPAGAGGADRRWIAMADFFGGRLRVVAPVVTGQEVAIGDAVELLEESGLPLLSQV